MKNKIFFGLVAILFIGGVIFAHLPDSLKMSFDTTGTNYDGSSFAFGQNAEHPLYIANYC